MPKTENGDKQTKLVIASAALKNYAGAVALLLGALPAVGALVISLVTTFRGEPVAEKTWETVRSEINEQSKVINNIHLRMEHLQGFQEGLTASSLQTRLDNLQKAYDKLKAKSLETLPSANALQAKVDCKKGYIRVDNNCVWATTRVAAVVHEAEKKAHDATVKLKTERRKRMSKERLLDKIKHKIGAPKAPLKLLPQKLDDVVQRPVK